MRVIHISDLHFPVRLKLHKLKDKCLVGYINYSLRRKKKHKNYEALIECIQSLDYDCLVLSGDITNVSDPTEFKEARRILEPILDTRAFLVPGNHDRYTKEALDGQWFEKYFGDSIGELLPHAKEEGYYIRYKNSNGFVIIGWDSNLPLPPMDAHGYLNPIIPKKTIQFLNESNVQNYMIVCHHPIWNPPEHMESERHRLLNREEILQEITNYPPLCYFHGHLHTNWIREPDSNIPFYIVNSASSTRISDENHESGFHLLEWDKKSHLKSYKRFTYESTLGKFIETKILVYRG